MLSTEYAILNVDRIIVQPPEIYDDWYCVQIDLFCTDGGRTTIKVFPEGTKKQQRELCSQLTKQRALRRKRGKSDAEKETV
jgi:hypothetical protein